MCVEGQNDVSTIKNLSHSKLMCPFYSRYPVHSLFLVSVSFNSKHTILQRTRLEAAFKALSTCSDDKTFAQLEEEEEEEVEEEHQARNYLSLRLSPSPEQETNQDPEQDVIFQGDSGSPMEASPTDQTDVVPKAQEAEWLSKTSSVLRNKRLWTVARLVVEPDSQGSSPASQEVEETEVRTEEPPQPPAAPDKSAELSVVTVDEDSLPVRKLRRRESNICSRYVNHIYIFVFRSDLFKRKSQNLYVSFSNRVKVGLNQM